MVAIRRAAGAVRLSVLDQGHHRTPDPVVAQSPEGAAVAKTDPGRGATRGGDRRRQPPTLTSGPRSPLLSHNDGLTHSQFPQRPFPNFPSRTKQGPSAYAAAL